MTKEQKFQKALEKWATSYKDDKNRVVTDSFCRGDLIKSQCDYIDIYSTIIYKHKPEWLVPDYRLLVGKHDDDETLILCLQNSVTTIFVTPNPISGFGDIEQISIECIPEEMLDEMLAVKDFEPIITIKVPDPTPKEKSQPKYKSGIIKYLPTIIAGVAIVISLIAIFVC